MFKRMLSTELKVWHLLLVVTLLAVSASAASAGQGAPTGANPNLTADGFYPTGVVNMATAQSNTSMVVHSIDGEVEVLRATFSIPAGQTAAVAAFFNAEAYKYANGYCYETSYLDTIGEGHALFPGEQWVADGYVYKGAYPTISAQGYVGHIAAGVHSVIVTLHTTGGDCYVDDRSLIVISNRHA
jgi:hypothetical protein